MAPRDWGHSNGFFKVSFFRHCPSEDGTQSGTQLGTQLGTQPIEDSILKLIMSNDRITRAEMSKALGISVRSLQRIMNGMDSVSFTGYGKSGYWEIKDVSER